MYELVQPCISCQFSPIMELKTLALMMMLYHSQDCFATAFCQNVVSVED